MNTGRAHDVVVVPTRRGAPVRARVWQVADGVVPGGDPDPPGLLLIHGFMGSSGSWEELVPRLPGAWRIAAVDLPGHGETLAGAREALTEGYTIPDVARLLGEVQASLFSRPVWWLGYSMGGRIALAAAAQGVSQAGLLLESASPGIRDAEGRAGRRTADGARAERLEALARASPGRRRAGMDAFVEEWLALPLFAGLQALPPQVRERAFRIRAGQDPGEMARWLREGGAGSQPWYGDALAGISRPVHALVGARDRKYADLWADLEARAPGVQTTRVPGSGHVPHLERPRAWAAWILDAVR